MKIQKKYQGAIPLNRIANEHNESEINTYSTQYLNSKFYTVSSTQPTNEEEVWIQKGKNLFNKNNVTNGFRIGSDGMPFVEEGYLLSEFIKVLPNQEYTWTRNFVGSTAIALYDKNYNLISRALSPSAIYTFVTDSDTAYIRFAIYQDDINMTQLELGPVSTSYEEYVGKKIFLKNDNGNYEEMINASEVNALIPRRIYPSFNWDYVYSTDLQYTCFKVGKMAFFNIHTLGFKSSAPNGTTIVSGLPKTANNQYICMYLDGGNGDGLYSCRCLITPGGVMNIHWGSPTHVEDSANSQYRGFIMYETND